MHSKKLLAILVAVLGACGGCKKTPPPTCSLGQPGASCSVAGDCCSNNCTNNVCIKDPCSSNGTSCGGASDCCTGSCDGTCNTPCTLAKLGESCNLGTDCCTGTCGSPNHICVSNPCTAPSATCALGTDCCTGNCDSGTTTCTNGICGLPDTACTTATASQCCSKQCANDICLRQNPKQNGEQCVDGSECATGYCTPTSPGRCADPPLPPPPCSAQGSSCTTATADSCCSKTCDKNGHCGPLGKCKGVLSSCETNADCCSLHCSSPGQIGATCVPDKCRQEAQSCSNNNDCCSGICTGNVCQPLPPGPTASTCGITGEACTLPTECCSSNCQGGRCWPASSCAADGDICWADHDCCTGLCATPAAAGQPGRCDDAPGNCVQSGLPCAGPSNCCTRQCADIGYGTTVCKIPSGCVMTGEYCDSTFACCGGVNEANPLLQNQYGVYCDTPGKHPEPPWFDSNNGGDYLCSRGQSCNPTGNICGDIASQNCCDGKKEVCQFDSNGIKRCRGNPDCCENGSGGSSTCGTPEENACCLSGYTGAPGCCIAAKQICQYSDQCCDGLPCVADAQGIFHCEPNSCTPRNATCDPSAPNCCGTLSCQNIEGFGYICTDLVLACTLVESQSCTPTAPAPDCCVPGTVCNVPTGQSTGTCMTCTLAAGATCTVGGAAPNCCIAPEVCTTAPGSTTGTCSLCSPKGGGCASAGDCCSPYNCDLELMTCYGCQPRDAGCRIDQDCCSGNFCDIPSGATSGTCQPSSTGCTSLTGQNCSVTADCCTPGDQCIGNVCTSTLCKQLGVQCDATPGSCCAPEQCYAFDAFNGNLIGQCTAADTNCMCKNTCAGTANSCSVDTPCCNNSDTCADSMNVPCAPGSAACTCHPPA